MEDQIASFLKKAHPNRQESAADIAGCADLFKNGWLDSLLQLRLLSFLENEFKIYIPAFQVSLTTFQSVPAIAALVRKLQKAGPVA